jgi:hypothetical protein
VEISLHTVIYCLLSRAALYRIPRASIRVGEEIGRSVVVQRTRSLLDADALQSELRKAMLNVSAMSVAVTVAPTASQAGL